MDETEIWDYGFSHLSEEEFKKKEIEKIEILEKNIASLKKNILGIKTIILPFLDHLKDDPSKPYLYWENRANKINDLINRIQKYFEEQ